ncbi:MULTISPECIES: 3-oxoacyl-ACP reductase FabG [Dietzia]|uniref:Alcohol dehydrogenase n=2 Tax=Dietzia TaxID=37914 RepID=A0AAD0NQG9_9ACTN|nr:MULTISPECIES: 3-oxoacyl-ACP reductase FabG [Dietzia]AWH95999.1 alcohol dehydrogenase [Dietzia psychralcaliphila]MBB1047566.1 SDR family oxidoreductase [Dietzia cercidiphylli]PTM90972.1 3-oxoacyl-[acyl-carrier-protein] reductase [Dietzia psychralcaliphila]
MFCDGAVALVTGGSRGIGRAAAKEFARSGVHVLVNYSASAGSAQETVSEIAEAGGTAEAVQCDVTEEDSVRDLFKKIRADHRRLDIAVTSAGVTNDRHLVGMSTRQYRETMSVNMDGTFYVCREAMRMMQARRAGAIVTVSSASGLDGGFPGQTNYAASKGAIIAFTRALALEGARHGIRANAVAPGFVETDMTRAVPAHLRNGYANRIRLGRMGYPEEIANIIAFLASDKASFVTGEVLVANGGGLE